MLAHLRHLAMLWLWCCSRSRSHRFADAFASPALSSRQGRGPNTQAYTHALEAGHHMFMKASDRSVCIAQHSTVVAACKCAMPNASPAEAQAEVMLPACCWCPDARDRSKCPLQIEDGRVYCLPDMYEVQDRSLGDIQYVLNPTFTRERAVRMGFAVLGCTQQRSSAC